MLRDRLSLPRLLLLLPVLLVALSGCVSIAAESARQLDEVGDVELTTVICATQARNAAEGCPVDDSVQGSTPTEYQVLMGYRIPSQAAPPETVAASDVELTLSRSTSYTAELQRLSPAPAGQQWVGYISPSFAYSPSQAEQSATIVARMMLVRNANGAPFPTPFHYRTIVGHRQTREDAGRPVSCGEALQNSNDDGTTCMSYPAPEQLASDLKVATRDLGILSGAVGTAPRGGSGAVTFTVAYSGEPPSPSFALAATTTVPGGTVTAQPSAAGDGPVPVHVSVPASTAPGIYEVTLTATHPNGQSRRSAGVVRVTGDAPVDRAPPELAVRLKSRPHVRRALKLGLVADISCSEACRVTAQLRASRRTAGRLGFRLAPGTRSVVVGSTREKGQAGGRRAVRIRFTRGLGPRLLRLRRVPLVLRVTARDPAGNARRRSVSFSLPR